MVGLIPAWVESGVGANAQLGKSKKEALALARDLRRSLTSSECSSIDLSNQEAASDTLHALCELIAKECLERPEPSLRLAEVLGQILGSLEWPNDEMGERERLLGSLSFSAWRASRVLRLSVRVQHWEGLYRARFRNSLLWESVESISGDEGGFSRFLERTDDVGSEDLFQILLYLQDQRDVDPRETAKTAESFYRSLQKLELPEDLQEFFLAETAVLVGGALRQVAQPTVVERWAELAEVHVQDDPDPRPTKERIALLRLTCLYEQSRYDLVVKGAAALERSFENLEMDEERIKCRILWAASLKLLGRFQEALDVLKRVREWKPGIRPSLYGWVLLNSGDLHLVCGDHSLALRDLGEAETLLREGKQFTGLADVHSMISCIYRSQGMLREALHLLKSSRDEHARLGMKSLEAANRMLIAETYLAMGRHRDAEVEIRLAIPVFEDQRMVADAVVGVNLLQEAMRRQRDGGRPVGDIRTHPRTKK